MTKDEQRSAAKDLFMLNWDQQDIARALNVSPTTMTKWATTGKWREERAKKYSLDESRGDRILNLIDFQITILEAITKDRLASGEMKLLDKGDIDALSKMFATIKGKDMSWSHYVNMTRELIEFLSTRDNELAKMLVEHTDAYLLHKRDIIAQ